MEIGQLLGLITLKRHNPDKIRWKKSPLLACLLPDKMNPIAQKRILCVVASVYTVQGYQHTPIFCFLKKGAP